MPRTSEAAPVLRLENITKRFGGFAANDDVTVELKKGEIVALLGENGAGKTTLMNILFGHYVPDAGRVLIDGKPLPQGRPRAAIDAGVGMMHQHFTLAPNLTVLDNVMTGAQSLLSLKSDTAAARAKLTALGQRFGLSVDPDAYVSALSVGERQRVEILKALYNDARILILDEPTAVLTLPEADHLFATLRSMAETGLSIIFISHKLREVMAASDRVIVLRAGRVVAERNTADTSREELAELMVGRRIARPVREAAEPGATLLSARNIHVRSKGGHGLFDISFDLRAHETLGIIGVSGNGQTALAHLVSALAHPESGTLEIFGKTQIGAKPRDLSALGIGRVPEDRNSEGVIGEFTLWENAVLERVRTPRFSRGGFVRRDAARDFARQVTERFDIRGGGTDSRTRLLSGGNMQKLIFGRNLATQPDILIAAQPTRGLDEGAIAAVHAEILKARDRGAAILLISEDLDEILALSDRVQAMVKGRLSQSFDVEGLDARALGMMMAGEWAGEHEGVA